MTSASAGGLRATRQRGIDERNAEFWDELCGTTLALEAGVTDALPESLARFDAAFLAMYPYLESYIPTDVAGLTTLEIGLGYGTLGQLLAARGANYHGLDLAEGPVAMMRHRLRTIGLDDADGRVAQGSALAIPHPSASFDWVVSIGCLHHTGDIAAGVAELRRVLRPGGSALVMLYNSHSARRLWLRARRARPEAQRAAFDLDARGRAAPHTEFVSRRQARQLFGDFATVTVQARNFDEIQLIRGKVRLPRRWFLGNLGRLAGLDLYVVATR